jgi:hypothetical protein
VDLDKDEWSRINIKHDFDLDNLITEPMSFCIQLFDRECCCTQFYTMAIVYHNAAMKGNAMVLEGTTEAPDFPDVSVYCTIQPIDAPYMM